MAWEERLRGLCHAGPLAVAGGWLVIGVTWYLNRGWFRFWRDAFSDLGGPGACCPWAYNYGLVLVGLLLVVFGACVWGLSRGRLEAGGGAYLALAGVFLALIGVFPSGTRPHTFVSTWFFVQSDLGLVTVLAGLYRRGCRGLTGPALALAVLAFPLAGLVEALVGWPSAASIEAYGVVIIDVGAIAVWLCYRGQSQ